MVVITAALSVLLLLLILGVLITAHELGHMWAAKAVGIRVNEFAIGMGPVIWSRQKGETKYSLRALPIGGFCAMEGEDASSDDPRAFQKQPLWARAVTLVAGSAMNFAVALLLAVVLFVPTQYAYTTVIGGFADGFPHIGESGLMEGDRILNIDGSIVFLYGDIPMLLDRKPGGPHDITVLRDGVKVTIHDLPLVRRPYTTDGVTESRFGLSFLIERTGFFGNLRNAWYTCLDMIRLIPMTLGDLIGGKASLDDMAGPVGIGGEINNVLQNEELTPQDRTYNILFYAVLIAANLAVMNLLPLPALDGGRMMFLLIELIRRKPVPAKFESWVHAAGLVFFLGLMVVVFFNDILKLIR